MNCKICEQLNTHYRSAVDALHVANQHMRVAKIGTLQFALGRREVHDSLHALASAEGELSVHRAWHAAAVASPAQMRSANL